MQNDMSIQGLSNNDEKHITHDSSSTAASQSRRLPQELTDLVIDQVASDPATLHACCLTSRAWVHHSRSHMFRSIYLHPDRYSVMYDLFRASPSLVSYVRELTVEAGTKDEDYEPIPRDTELPHHLLALFQDITNLHIINMRWYKLNNPVKDFFYANYPSLVTLRLTEVEFDDVKEVLALIRSFPILRELSLRKVVWDEDLDLTDPVFIANATIPVYLEDMAAYECTHPQALIEGLYHRGYGRGLYRIALDWGESEDPRVLRKLILAAGPMLRILEVDLSWHEPAVTLDLHNNNNLRDVYVDGLPLDQDHDLSWVPAMVAGISSSSLRLIVFYPVICQLTDLERVNLEQMDEILSQAQFDSLEIVGFIVTILPYSAGVPPPSLKEIHAVIRGRMLKVDSRRLMCFHRPELLERIGL